jgi:hypothetical protein
MHQVLRRAVTAAACTAAIAGVGLTGATASAVADPLEVVESGPPSGVVTTLACGFHNLGRGTDGREHWYITNCHDYAVSRKIRYPVATGYIYGSCYRIAAGDTKYGSTDTYVGDGIVPC